MVVWSTLLKALRGGLNESGESAIDAQALRILDHEVRDARAALADSKTSLANILARQKMAEKRYSELKGRIVEYETYAIEALNIKNDNLAIEIAENVADMERSLQTEIDVEKRCRKNAENLHRAMAVAEKNIQRIQQQIDTVKATESIQKAQSALAERYQGSESRIRTAMDSLSRIKGKQSLRQAQIEAAKEMADGDMNDSLDEKLQAAGIRSSSNNVEKVLARLKSKK